MLARVLTAGVGQITFSALCSDENVADAPTSTPATERIAVRRAMSACHAFATIASSARAASSPTTPLISPKRRPCTASAPKKMLATAITMTSVGAIEKAAKNAIAAENIRQWSCAHCVSGAAIHETSRAASMCGLARRARGSGSGSGFGRGCPGSSGRRRVRPRVPSVVIGVGLRTDVSLGRPRACRRVQKNGALPHGKHAPFVPCRVRTSGLLRRRSRSAESPIPRISSSTSSGRISPSAVEIVVAVRRRRLAGAVAVRVAREFGIRLAERVGVEFVLDVARVALLALHVRAAVRRIARPQRAGAVPLADFHSVPFRTGPVCFRSSLTSACEPCFELHYSCRVMFRTGACREPRQRTRPRAGSGHGA